VIGTTPETETTLHTLRDSDPLGAAERIPKPTSHHQKRSEQKSRNAQQM
jgi:hypothetical protein